MGIFLYCDDCGKVIKRETVVMNTEVTPWEYRHYTCVEKRKKEQDEKHKKLQFGQSNKKGT